MARSCCDHVVGTHGTRPTSSTTELLFPFQVRGDHKSTVVHSQYWYGDYCVDVTDSVCMLFP